MLLFSYLCCHILIIFLLMTDFISFLPRGTLASTKFFFNASFANLSAVSFPTIPICVGTQQKYTIITSTFSLYSNVYISTSRSSLSVFVGFILLRAFPRDYGGTRALFTRSAHSREIPIPVFVHVCDIQCWVSYSKNVIYYSLLVTPFKSNIVTYYFLATVISYIVASRLT